MEATPQLECVKNPPLIAPRNVVILRDIVLILCLAFVVCMLMSLTHDGYLHHAGGGPILRPEATCCLYCYQNFSFTLGNVSCPYLKMVHFGSYGEFSSWLPWVTMPLNTT